MKTAIKNTAIALLLLMLSSAAGFAQQQKLRDPGKKQLPRVNPRRAAIEEIVLAFYINQFPQVAEVSDEVFVKVLPFLREFIQDRFETSNRRRRALNQLRMITERGGTDEEIRRWIGELDSADGEIQVNQQRFLSNVDPLLNTRQQAKLRMYLDVSDQRIRRMITDLQNPGRQNPAAVDANKN
jgi:hypothetical protein